MGAGTLIRADLRAATGVLRAAADCLDAPTTDAGIVLAYRALGLADRMCAGGVEPDAAVLRRAIALARAHAAAIAEARGLDVVELLAG